MKKRINEMRKKLIRKEIGNEPEIRNNVKILDNGAGQYGSWDYEKYQNITSCDILTGTDCQNLPYSPEFFDIVVFSGVIQYVKDPNKALEECSRILKKRGFLIVATINKNSIIKKITGWKEEELWKWNLNDFKNLVQSSGFEIKKEKMIDFFFIPNKYKMVIYLKCQKK